MLKLVGSVALIMVAMLVANYPLVTSSVVSMLCATLGYILFFKVFK